MTSQDKKKQVPALVPALVAACKLSGGDRGRAVVFNGAATETRHAGSLAQLGDASLQSSKETTRSLSNPLLIFWAQCMGLAGKAAPGGEAMLLSVRAFGR